MNTFEEIEHKYPTRFSKYNFKQPPAFKNYDKPSIFSRGPQTWNGILLETEKKFPNSNQRITLSSDNELGFFRSKKLTRSAAKIMHTFILHLRVLGDKV